jgi:hypothetical protein
MTDENDFKTLHRVMSSESLIILKDEIRKILIQSSDVNYADLKIDLERLALRAVTLYVRDIVRGSAPMISGLL